MENVILIRVSEESDLADLAPNTNFVVHVEATDTYYRANSSGDLIKMADDVSRPQTIRLVESADELLFTDYIIECAGTTYNIDLPDPSNMATGQTFYINNNASGTINLVPFGTSGIQGVGNANYPITTGLSVCICVNANSNGWLILAKS